MASMGVNPPIELVLFYAEDPRQEVESVLGIFKIAKQAISAAEMLALFLRSVRRHMPEARLRLITDQHTTIHREGDGIEVLRGHIRQRMLIYDRMRLYTEYVEAAVAEGREANIVFIDFDILLNKSLAPVFDVDRYGAFDIAFSANFDLELHYSARGVPVNTLLSLISGGAVFVRATPAAAAFHREWLAQTLHNSKHDPLPEYGPLAPKIHTEFLKWWGGIHTLSLMLGPEMTKKPEFLDSHGARIRLLPDALYNVTPEMREANGAFHLDMAALDMETPYIFHLRGGRKIFMRALAERMGLAETQAA